MTERICRICKKKFTTWRKDVEFCSSTCRKEHRKRDSKRYYYENKEQILRKNKEYEKTNRHKKNAQQKAGKILIPKNKLCENCNKQIAKERHHKDYDKPLEVKFLCVGCHKREHSKNKLFLNGIKSGKDWEIIATYNNSFTLKYYPKAIKRLKCMMVIK